MGRRMTVSTWCLTLAVLATRTASAAEGFSWQDGEGETTLLFDGKPTLRYMHSPLDESSAEARELTIKPFHHVFSPDGETQLTKGPGGLYPHHRGLFFGFNKVTHHGDQPADVWHCREGESQVQVGVMRREADADSAQHLVAIEWRGQDGKTFAVEHRQLGVRRATQNGVEGWLIDFSSHVGSADGEPVHLDGDPQHAGFHFRAAQEDIANTNERDQNREKQIYFIRTSGKGSIGETRNWDQNNPDSDASADCVNRPWNAMSFLLHGKRYTVLYLDHPSNPKPARYSERAYGRFGSYFVADVTADAPLSVKYRVWVQDGEMTQEQCEAMSAEFNSENTVLPAF
jgi:hypothetical protein